MSTSGFWDNVLEPDETLLWTGRPKPRLHWRNWRLFAPAPMAAAGLLAAGWFIIFTTGSDGDMWLLILLPLYFFSYNLCWLLTPKKGNDLYQKNPLLVSSKVRLH